MSSTADLSSLFDPPPEQVIETHISRVYLCGDRAYKQKKAVTLPYLDFAPLAARKAFAERELLLNSRTAPQIYRGVEPVYRRDDGTLSFAPPGEVIDWLVAMRRFDPDCTLDRLEQRGAIDGRLIEQVAAVVAGFHAAAPQSKRTAGDMVAQVLRINDAAFAALDPAAFASGALSGFRARLGAEVAAQAQHLAARDGHVRRAHGDLHLRNIALLDGRPVIFDCLEFDEDLATIDTAYDFAFLLMDLLAAGHRDHASRALNRYLEASGDTGMLALLPLYIALRAAVRAHIAGLKPETWPEARRYLALAEQALQPAPPRLAAIAGLSGTGKSTVARAVAPDLGGPCGAVVLRSDAMRKHLFGCPQDQRLAAEAYTEAASARTYAALLAAADAILGQKVPVVLDAVFGRQSERQAAAALAAKHGVPFTGLWLSAPLETLMTRVTARRQDVSDANDTVVRIQHAAIQPPTDWTEIDSGGDSAATAARAARALGL